MPPAGTTVTTKAVNSPSYGSFGNTNINTNDVKKRNNQDKDIIDNDSGMSSEENDDSLKYDASANNKNNIDISSTLDDTCEVITKCLNNEPHRAEHWNEIPCCSNDINNLSVIIDEKTKLLDVDVGEVSEFIVIDLTCDVNNDTSKSEKLRTNSCTVDHLSINSLGSSQSLVPVNNEIVRSDNQKLVSLSLSILLAALLQAMRCFAQFIEDIVVPQR